MSRSNDGCIGRIKTARIHEITCAPGQKAAKNDKSLIITGDKRNEHEKWRIEDGGWKIAGATSRAAQKSQNFGVLSKNVGKVAGIREEPNRRKMEDGRSKIAGAASRAAQKSQYFGVLSENAGRMAGSPAGMSRPGRGRPWSNERGTKIGRFWSS